MTAPEVDLDIRLTAFKFLREQQQVHGDILPYDVLKGGFEYQEKPVKVIGPQGIFKPRGMDLPLSIMTVPPTERRIQPYEDEVGAEGILFYRYRGKDPGHPDNEGLREVMRRKLPLVYFYGIIEGRYFPLYPVFVGSDSPATLTFIVRVDDADYLKIHGQADDADMEARRKYVTMLVQRRLHQQSFRARVLEAYAHRCAICRLKRDPLLDAAHILPDGHPKGQPVVPNGLSLCKLHHAAFDKSLLGISPDYVIKLREDILDEEDGPMLEYGIQSFHEKKLIVPRPVELKPDRDRLAERYENFRASA